MPTWHLTSASEAVPAGSPVLGSPAVDLRLVPLALAAWVGAWVGTGGSLELVGLGGMATGVLAAAAAVRRSWLLVAVVLVAVGALGVGALQAAQLSNGPLADLARAGAVVRADVTVTADPQLHPAVGPKPPYVTARATVHEAAGRGRDYRARAPVLVVASGARAGAWAALPVGSTVQVTGRWAAPSAGEDLVAVIRITGREEVVTGPNLWLRAVQRVRAGLRAAVQHRRPEQRALVPALVLGDTGGLTTALKQDFQTTALTHLTAVSGENLTLLLASMLLAARWMGVRGWWLRGVGVFGIVAFVGLCRTEPSVLRAAAMGLVALAALGAGGRHKGPRHLAVAMIGLLLLDPWLARSLGFALSVLASAGIIWWSGRWTAALRRWLPGPAAEAIGVPLAAHLATVPVVAAIAGRVSLVGVLANGLAGPLVGPATVLGFAAAWLSLVSTRLAAVAGFGAAWCSQGILWVAHLGAAVPGASRQWPTSVLGLAVLTLASLGLGVVMPLLLRTPWISLPLAVLLVLVLVRAPAVPGWPPSHWVLVACDVGQGDGLVVRAADHRAVLIDAGPDPVRIDTCLRQLQVTDLPLVVLTHFHADHVGGLTGALNRRRVGQILISPLAAPAREAAAVAALARARNIPLTVGGPGQRFTVGESSWQVIGPLSVVPLAADSQAGASDPESSVENDASLVALVTVDGIRLLLSGDAEPDSQARILQSGVDLHADVLKVPHHGSVHQDAEFLAASHARVAIASAGLHNDYGHPSPRTLQRVQDDGMTVLRTDLDGSVAVSVIGGQLRLFAQHHPG